MKSIPEEVLRHPRIFRLTAGAAGSQAGLRTGYPQLDACLPGGGWPRAALNEILVARFGSGELQLVIPALVSLCAPGNSSDNDMGHRSENSQENSQENNCGNSEAYWLTLISPPHIPYAPALASAGLDLARILVVRTRRSQDALWAAEQALRSGTCRAVLLWSEQADSRHLRRLQLAAEEGNCWGLIFRPDTVRKSSSPATLRLQLSTDELGTQLELLKVRGGRPARVTTAHFS